MTLTDSLSRRQSNEGAVISVIYTSRYDTPDFATLRARFDDRVTLNNLHPSRALFKMGLHLRRAFKANEYDVVHLHSTYAGFVGRLALIGIRTKTRVFYSPHGFAFLRTNQKPAVRRLIALVEFLLSRTSSKLILTSESEALAAKRTLRVSTTTVLNTGIPLEMMRKANLPSSNLAAKPLVGCVGRVSFQKAPWRFAAVARELHETADFIWIGGGSTSDIEKWLADAPVKVTGWVDPPDLANLIDTLDVFLFPSLWEGMALSLIQAQGQGIPAVTTDAVGNVDSVLDGVSGFICRTEEELVERTRLLVSEPLLREQFSKESIKWARRKLSDENVGSDSIRIYLGS